MLLKSQLCLAEHVSRLGNHQLPRIILYIELSARHREKGAPLKLLNYYFKNFLGACHIGPISLRNVTPGVSPPSTLSPLLKTLAESPSKTKGTGVRAVIL